MRYIATLTILLLAIPAASAGILMEDETGDEEFQAGGVTADNPRADLADLVNLQVGEDDAGFLFTLTHGPVPDPALVIIDDVEYNVHFRHEDRHFVLEMRLWFPVDDSQEGYKRATLYEADGEGSKIDALTEVQVLESEETVYKAHVERDLLRDHNGVPPTAGRTLTDFYVVSRASDFLGFSINGQSIDAALYEYHDRMPDEGTYDEPLVSGVGLPQNGIGLHSATPLRWSNGEETSFAFEVEVMEWVGDEQHVTFALEDVPDGWHVSVPAPVHLGARDHQTIDVVAHVPFAHDHGATTTFRLVATSGLPESLGQIDLGVYYPEIPQPTGHHNMLFVHSQDLGENLLFDTANTALGQDARYRAFLNTQEQDGEGVPVPGDKRTIDFDDDNVPRPIYSWRLPLDPALRMGLDFDLDTEGTARFTFDSPVDTMGATFEGILRVAPPGVEEWGGDPFDQEGIVATLSKVSVDGGSSVTFETTVVPTELGDVVSYDPDQQLYLDLFVMPMRPEVVLTPSIGVDLVSGQMRLPLEEYHDTVRVPISVPQQEIIDETKPDSIDDEGPESKDTPGIGALAVLAVAALLAVTVRRRD